MTARDFIIHRNRWVIARSGGCGRTVVAEAVTGRVLNIAHRGASGRFPENTLAAFDAAIAAGALMCELDVRLSRDGALVVIHDDTVDRTTDGHGPVSGLALAELKRLDAGARFGVQFAGERIPTLAEVFALMGDRCALNLEIKARGAEPALCESIRTHGALASALVSSFDWAALEIVRHLEPRARIAPLASQWPARLLGAATEIGAAAINPRADLVTEDLCIAAHQRNLSVNAWTVDEASEMRRLIACGVDGIMTNYPERLYELVGDWG